MCARYLSLSLSLSLYTLRIYSAAWWEVTLEATKGASAVMQSHRYVKTAIATPQSAFAAELAITKQIAERVKPRLEKLLV